MKRILLVSILLQIATLSFAQVPVISSIDATTLYPKGRVVITGSGFSATSANLQVWFGQVQGTIVSSTEFSITADVPPAASYGNIVVINKTSRRMATSNFKFTPSFYGEAFDASKLVSAGSFTSLNELRDVCSCDLNNDGKPDMVATKFSAATDILILHNTSTGPGNISFAKIAYSLNFSSDHITCGDVDGDGFPDLVITKGGSSNRNTVFVVRNMSTAGGAISLAAVPYSLFMDVGHVAIRSALRDLTGDGRPEIVVTNTTNNTLYIFQNDPTKPLGTNPFLTTPVKVTVAEVTNTYGIEVQDFDGDGRADILLNSVSVSDHYIIRNRSNTTIDLSAAQKITLPGQLRNSMSADINNDGKLDIITSSTGTNKVLVLMNQSTSGTFAFNATPIELQADNAPWGISVSDIDGDKDPDIVVANQLNATVNIFIHNGDWANPAFTKHNLTTPRPARNVVAADLDSDGRPEISAATFVIGSYAIDVFRNTICHKPFILNEEPAYLCNNPIELKAVPAINVTFDWRQNGTTFKNGADAFASATVGGTYTVQTTSINPANECVGIASETFTVTGSAGSVPENPVINLNSPVCSGATLNLSTPDAAAGASYKWSGPNGWTTTTSTPSTSIPSVTSVHGGAYTVQVIVGNCKSNVSPSKVTDVVTVDNFAITSNSATNSTCQPSSVNLSVNNVSGFTYEWMKDGVSQGAPSTTTTYAASSDGSYSVRVVNTTLGCPAQTVGPVKVAIMSVPVADFSIGNPKCSNVPLQFTNLSTIDPDAQGASPVAPVQWNWNFGNATTSNEKDPLKTYSGAGTTYNVTLTVSYLGVAGCTHAKTIPVTITGSTLPGISSSAAAICPGESADLLVSGDFQSFAWDHGASGPTISINEPGTYTVKATDANGCVVPQSIVIGSKDIPIITITPETPAIPAGQSVQLFATGAHTFEWTPTESLNEHRIPDPIATPETTTTYTVTGFFNDGCSSQATVTVLVDVSEINIQIPLAFSPNGDGSNQRWEIEGVEKYPDCTMNVFDSRGKRIYQKKGYDNQWDGTYEGRPVPDGTYYYVFGCPNLKPLTGSVLIFR